MFPRKMSPGSRCLWEGDVFGKETSLGRCQPQEGNVPRKEMSPAKRCPWEGVTRREMSLGRRCPREEDIPRKEDIPASSSPKHPSMSSLELGTRERAPAEGAGGSDSHGDAATLGE